MAARGNRPGRASGLAHAGGVAAVADRDVDADTDEHGELVVVRNGKYGPYVKRGDDTASLPDGIALDELTLDKAIELLNAPKGD